MMTEPKKTPKDVDPRASRMNSMATFDPDVSRSRWT